MMKHVERKVKNHMHNILTVKMSAHEIALGFAVGTLMGIIPTLGFGFLIGLIVAILYKKISKLALFGALLLWNPVTTAPLYVASIKIGDLIFGFTPVVKYKIVILNSIYNFSRKFLIGNFIIAVVLSLSSYFIVKYLAVAYNKKREINNNKGNSSGKNKKSPP